MRMLLICIIVFLTSFIGVYIYRWLAIKKAILDLPNERSSHQVPTPRGGGIAVVLTWFVSITFFYLNGEIDSSFFFALLCGLPISIIGLIDDVISISSKIRLIIQIASATVAVVLLGGLNIDFGLQHLIFLVLLSLIYIIGLTWFTNLFNFLDGIDGYISSEVIFICLAAFLLFRIELPLVLLAATAGFLVWNWQPAKIFMGDVGSTLIGFTIGLFSIYYQNRGESSIIIWLMLTSLFWFDASLTLYRRWRNGEILTKAHKKHAYQRIVQTGFSHQKTVLFSIFINIFILGLVILVIKFPSYSLIVLVVNLLFLYLLIKLVDKRLPSN